MTNSNDVLVRDALLEDKFVTIWPDYPCLYDVRLVDFRNRDLLQKAMEPIWLVKSDVMSLMYVRNISGPGTVPWGTPEMTGASPDDLPSTITLCVLFVKYVVNHL